MKLSIWNCHKSECVKAKMKYNPTNEIGAISRTTVFPFRTPCWARSLRWSIGDVVSYAITATTLQNLNWTPFSDNNHVLGNLPRRYGTTPTSGRPHEWVFSPYRSLSWIHLAEWYAAVISRRVWACGSNKRASNSHRAIGLCRWSCISSSVRL
jgi:hypothetical protein